MTRAPLLVGLVLALAGCGDNSRVCGPGTVEHEGVCEGVAGESTCLDGTRLDEARGGCAIDPGACRAGTVLLGDACREPHDGLVVDVLEGPEPNGLGAFGEASLAPAGLASLKPAGARFVLKGTIAPAADTDGDGQLDADADTYELVAAAPALVAITADGVDGLVAGFTVTADVAPGAPLAGYAHDGLSFIAATARRQVYLPAAGTYRLAVFDARTALSGGAAVAAASASPGAPPLTYYVTLEALEPPAPTALTVTGGAATSSGTLAPGVPRLFSVPLGGGANRIALDLPDALVTGAVIVTAGGAVRALGDDTGELVVDQLPSGTTALIVVDAARNPRHQPTPYTLDVAIAD